MSTSQERNQGQESGSLFPDEVVWKKEVSPYSVEGCRMTVIRGSNANNRDYWDQLIFIGTDKVISMLRSYLEISGLRIQTAGDSVLTLGYDFNIPGAREQITSWLDSTICPHTKYSNQTE